MDELTSTEFRKTYARLTAQAMVTVNGHLIGVWTPTPALGTSPLPEPVVRRSPVDQRRHVAATQAERDDLLRKINRSK